MINEIQPKIKFQNIVQCPFKKEKEEKKRSKESHYPNKQVNNFTVTLWGMRQKTSIFVPLPQKGE